MKGKTTYIRQSFRLYLPPAVGYNFPLLMKLLHRHGVDRGYLGRALVISLISLIGVPFRIYEKLAFDNRADRVRLEEPPVFILGHWRSGTTFLHNLLCEDPDAAFVTTYQSVFPDQTLAAGSRFIFRNIMKMLIPINRKGDNVKLGTDYPQEEEFALAARHPASFYFFWYFPELIMPYYDKFLTFEHSKANARDDFMADYRRVIGKAMIHSGKTRFLSKNPVNTGRIPMLLEMFPDARFIYIHRNPVEVILSTRNFFEKMTPGLTLHKVDYQEVNKDIYTLYDRLMKRYLDTRAMVPAGNLVEIGYDDLIADPLKKIGDIYEAFGWKGWDVAKPGITSYAESRKGYERNKYSIPQHLLDEILTNTEFAMKEWQYDIPRHFVVTE